MNKKNKNIGYIQTLIASIEVWHINFVASIAVIIFVYWQAYSIFAKREKRKKSSLIITQKNEFRNDDLSDLRKIQKKFVDKKVIFF